MCKTTAACLNKSHQLLSSSRHLLMCMYSRIHHTRVKSVFVLCDIYYSSHCILMLCGIVCMVTAVCLNNSQQLLSSSDICSCLCLSKYTINAHNLYVQLLSKTDLNGTPALWKSVQRYLGNGVTSSQSKELVPQE